MTHTHTLCSTAGASRDQPQVHSRLATTSLCCSVAVDLATVTNRHGEYHQRVVIDLAQNPVGTHTVAPLASSVRRQRFAVRSRVRGAVNILFQPRKDHASNRLVQTPQLFRRGLGHHQPPNLFRHDDSQSEQGTDLIQGVSVRIGVPLSLRSFELLQIQLILDPLKH